MSKTSNKVRIGIWLPLSPLNKVRGEGLLRLLTLIASGFDPKRHSFVFFCPIWLRKEMADEIKDYPPALQSMFSVQSIWSSFSIVTLAMYFSYILANRRQAPKPRLKSGLRQWVRRRKLASLLGARRLVLAGLKTSIFIPLCATAALILGWMLNAAVGFLWSDQLAQTASDGIHWIQSTGLSVLHWAQLTVSASQSLVMPLILLASVATAALITSRFGLRAIKSAPFIRSGVLKRPYTWVRAQVQRAIAARAQLNRMFQAHEYRQMALRANKTAKVDVWLTVHPQFDSARYLKKPLVAFFADFVFLDCPGPIEGKILRRLKLKVQRVMKRANAVIVFSEHVRTHQLNQFIGIEQMRSVRVIPHAMIDYPSDCPELSELASAMSGKMQIRDLDAMLIREFFVLRSKKVLRRSPRSHPDVLMQEYLQSLPFADITYIFCSTQNRSYKNLVNLAKAVETLIRERYRNVKLILTGQMYFDESDDALAQYVRDKQLHWDIVSIPRVPRLVHAALFRSAAVTVHPSFFEGGFPFTFAESVSMGTPVLLSRAPTTLEQFPLKDMESFLFDPYSVTNLADKIEWALANRAQLLAQQRRLYDASIQQRDWRRVGREYAQVFDDVLQAAASNQVAVRPRGLAPSTAAPAMSKAVQIDKVR